MLAFIANIFAAFAEQTAAILIAFGLISILWCKAEKRKVSKTLIVHYVIIVILSLINLLAPGNSARSYAEELKWYPSFSTLSLSDKLVQGYIQTANHIINDTTVLFSIIAVISSYFIITDKKTNKINKGIAIIPILYVMARVIPFNMLFEKVLTLDIDGIINYQIFNFERFNIYTLFSKRIFLQLFLSTAILAIVAVQLIYICKNKKNGIIASILYLASICSALVLSLSPTIYASGNRVFMSTDILLVIISSMLSIKLFQTTNKKNKSLSYILLIVLIALSCLFYLNLYKNGISTIIY